MGYNGDAYEVGTRTRGKRERGETYRVGTRSELTGVVSEWVLTLLRLLGSQPQSVQGIARAEADGE